MYCLLFGLQKYKKCVSMWLEMLKKKTFLIEKVCLYRCLCNSFCIFDVVFSKSKHTQRYGQKASIPPILLLLVCCTQSKEGFTET